jgi:hypothetical protein
MLEQAEIFARSIRSGSYVLGIDPGLRGAVVALDIRSRAPVRWYRFECEQIPGRHFINRAVYVAGFHKFASDCDLAYPVRRAFVEEPLPFTISKATLANQHQTLGRIEATLGLLLIPAIRIAPQSWQRYYGLIGKGKRESVEVATSLMPELGKLRVKDSDIAEAALIGRFGIINRGIDP